MCLRGAVLGGFLGTYDFTESLLFYEVLQRRGSFMRRHEQDASGETLPNARIPSPYSYALRLLPAALRTRETFADDLVSGYLSTLLGEDVVVAVVGVFRLTGPLRGLVCDAV